MTIASSPTFNAFALPSVATASWSGCPSARIPAMSLSGCRAKILASNVEPSANVTVILSASFTTWRAVRMSASASKTTPLPRLVFPSGSSARTVTTVWASFAYSSGTVGDGVGAAVSTVPSS